MQCDDVVAANERLAGLDAAGRVAWARSEFGGRFCVTSSFGLQAAVMLHLVAQVDRSIPVLFSDTGYHFSETLAYRDYLAKRLGLRVVAVRAELLRLEFEEEHGDVRASDPDLCCRRNKVEPLRQALRDYDCWATGIRRTQTDERREVSFLQPDRNQPGRWKLAPIADFSDQEVTEYFARFGLPPHPLAAKGYTSVGCAGCTRRPEPGSEPRSGRWGNTGKTECGLHLVRGPGEGI
jgi:phosphoadenosine phosphosulfate reductase